MSAVALSVMFLAATRPAALAQFVPVCGEHGPINEYTSRNQHQPALVDLSDGGYVVFWAQEMPGSDNPDLEFEDIAFRRMSNTSNLMHLTSYANDYKLKKQLTPRSARLVVAPDEGNGEDMFVVVWASDGQDGDQFGVYMRRYQLQDNVSHLPLVLTPTDELVNTQMTTGNQYEPAVAGLTTTGFVVTWTSVDDDPMLSNVMGQRYGNDGTPLGQHFAVAPVYLPGTIRPHLHSHKHSRVAGLGKGQFVIVWDAIDKLHQVGSPAPKAEIYAQRYTASGDKNGAAIKVNTMPVTNNHQNYQQHPDVTYLAASDRFVVVWESSKGENGDNVDVYMQRFDASTGNPLGTNTVVNSYTTRQQRNPAVSHLDDGGYVVVWESCQESAMCDDFDIYARRYDMDGVAQTDKEEHINTGVTLERQYDPAVTGLRVAGGGGKIDYEVCWTSDGEPFPNQPGDIKCRRMSVNC